jgi:putative transposase
MPSNLRVLGPEAFLEMRLVWDRAGQHYMWHLVVEDNLEPAESPGDRVADVDLGEIHPAVVTDSEEAIVFSAREMRSLAQYTHKRLAEIQAKQARKIKVSRAWKRLQRRKNWFLAHQGHRRRDLEHKVSRAVGDVRDAADRAALGYTNN